MFELMLLPFIACLIQIGILVYFGIHIVEREVIFVDLSLAQIAALGSIIALIFGIELHSVYSYIFSLAFTFFGATIFTFTRFKEKKVSQEAIIGIVYAVSAACSILVLEKAPYESEHIKHMLVGNLLFVKPPEIIKMVSLYSIIGLFHFIYRRKFMLISINLDEAKRQNLSIKLWDFLFYISFGIVVTSSVEVSGVLLLFSYLIVPAVCAIILSGKFKTRLLLGWLFGILSSLVGLYFSATFDFPTGASIVCSFGLFVLIILIFNQIRKL